MTDAVRIVAHGGVGGRVEDTDGPAAAVARARDVLAAGEGALAAAIAGVVDLEDDPRFDAGTGSHYRLDGRTIEMDAAVMDETGRIGAVAAIGRVKNPVLVARRVADTPHILLAGPPAVRFARALGFADHDPTGPGAAGQYRTAMAALTGRTWTDWRSRWYDVDLAGFWNFETPYEEAGPTGTVGLVVAAAGGLAVALSTGGATPMLAGRIGDTPLPGAGFWASPAAAVTATGIGEEIARHLLSKEVHDLIAAGASPAAATAEGLARVPAGIPIGLVAVSPSDWGVAATGSMPWAAWTGGAAVDALSGPVTGPA